MFIAISIVFINIFCFIYIEEKLRLEQEEERRIQALLDMNEDDYEALPYKKQKEIDKIRHQRYLEKKEKSVIT